MNYMRFLLFVVAAGLFPVLGKAQQFSIAQQKEQTIFGAETEIASPVNVPEDVLEALRSDKRNQTCLAENESAKKIVASWFSASKIHLNSDGLPDLVVTATNPCLFGANLHPFWIFRKTPRGHKLVLSVSALGLEVLSTRSKGYRNIRTTVATATTVGNTVFRFDGIKYNSRRR